MTAADAHRVEQVEAAGLKTAVGLAGPVDGPPVLLLHGGGIDRASMCWRETLPVLARRYRVIAPDLPGYGDSDGFDRPQGVPELGRWAAALLDAVEPRPVVAVGCSMGGAIALWLALNRPGGLRGVVPISSYGLARRAALQPLVAHWPETGGGRLMPALAAHDEILARLVHSAIFLDPRRIDAEMVRSFREEARAQTRRRSFNAFLRAEVALDRFATCFADDLPRLSCPALFVHGRFDTLVGHRHAQRAAAACPDASLLTVNAGHWPHRERPEVVQPRLLDFLANIS